MSDIVWHDVECGRYLADLPLWKELAQNAERILDVGAGTGRVTLRLVEAGHDVTALDIDAELLAALQLRSTAPIATITADASDFTTDGQFDLIAVPMQTIQLLSDRDGFFASARRALKPGGLLAVAIATDIEAYDGGPPLPAPDIGHEDGWTYISQPVAIRVDDEKASIDRIRQLVSPHEERTTTEDLIELFIVTPGGLAEEAAVHGLEAEELRHIAETPEHVASQVVLFRG